MAFFSTFNCFLLFVLIYSLIPVNNAELVCCDYPPYLCNATTFNRALFGEDFIFGTGTASYQIEGVQGRAFNVWDTFTHRWPERTADGKDGDLATDSLHLYKDDVAMLKRMGMDSYRFSIAWSRVLPKGTIDGGINEEGITYYHDLIDELLENGIKPFVTIFHWDLPQALQDKYDGFVSNKIIRDFVNYADLLFERFGKKVKFWATLNQPFTYADKGHADGKNAPGRCTGCKGGGNSGTEPYIVAHHLLLAHASTVSLYRRKYKKSQNGQIGITIIARWFKPYSNSPQNIEATERALDFMFGWFMAPLTKGDYPDRMKRLVGDRLPTFTESQSQLVNGSLDFLGLNYYLTDYTYDTSFPAPDPEKPHYQTDRRYKATPFNEMGNPIGVPTPSFYYYPRGFQELLQYVRENYYDSDIYITENGYNDNGTLSVEDTLNDYGRIEYHCSHLCHLRKAMENGAQIKGYFAWSLLDNYEFGQGYTMRFGLNYVDFNNPSDRRAKLSADWYTRFAKKDSKKKSDDNIKMTTM